MQQELDCPYDFTSRCTMGRCDCKMKNTDLNSYKSEDYLKRQDNKISVKAPCPNQGSACFCTGACQKIIGYVDKPSNSKFL